MKQKSVSMLRVLKKQGSVKDVSLDHFCRVAEDEFSPGFQPTSFRTISARKAGESIEPGVEAQPEPQVVRTVELASPRSGRQTLLGWPRSAACLRGLGWFSLSFPGLRANALHPGLYAAARLRGLKTHARVSSKSLGNDNALKRQAKIKSPLRRCKAVLRFHHRQSLWNKWVIALFLAFFVMAGLAHNTHSVALAQSDPGADTDPTKPVVFSVREEFYNPEGNLWRYFFILRADKAILTNKGKLSGKRGFLLRSDLPIVMAEAGGNSNLGLGDLYGQVLWLPYLTRKFGFATGSGLVAPTATNKTLGAGKWQIAPAAIPIWFFERKGLFFVKFQDYLSFAGNSNRTDIHYTNVDATFLWKLRRRWWIVTDTELNANWKKNGSTRFKSGLMVGRMLNPTFGIWVKPEIPYGKDSGGGWILKSSFFWVRP